MCSKAWGGGGGNPSSTSEIPEIAKLYKSFNSLISLKSYTTYPQLDQKSTSLRYMIFCEKSFQQRHMTPRNSRLITCKYALAIS